MPFDAVIEVPAVEPMPPLPVIDGIEIRHVAEAPGYAVTSQGQVLTCRKRGKKNPDEHFGKHWRRLSDVSTPQGYQFVLVRIDGKTYRRSVHRIVLEAFVSARPPGLHCRHMNGVRWDNRPINLQWGTPQENADDKRRHGTQPIGSKCSRAKLTEAQVAEIRAAFMAGDRDRAAMAERYGVSSNLISQIVTGKGWKHVGTINYYDALTVKGGSGREFTGFGLRFRTARRAAKLSHVEIARVCGCSKQAVSFWECGAAWPSGDRLTKACEAMGVTVESITAGDSRKPGKGGRPRTRPIMVGPKRGRGRPRKPADDTGSE